MANQKKKPPIQKNTTAGSSLQSVKDSQVSRIPRQPMMDHPEAMRGEQGRSPSPEKPKVIVKQMAVPEVRIFGQQIHKKYSIGQKASDRLAKIGGSWGFIGIFAVLLVVWMIINFYMVTMIWDPYPFILLNLVLSCLAAVQAPIILMSQNRAAERDRAKAERDYAVNRKAEREVELIKKDLDHIKKKLAEIKAGI